MDLIPIIGAFVVVVLGYVIGSEKQIPEGKQALVEREGRYSRKLSSGINFVIPFLDQIVVEESIKEQLLDTQPIEAITKDKVKVKVVTNVFWKILELEKAWYQVGDIRLALDKLVQMSIKKHVNSWNLEQYQVENNKFSNCILDIQETAKRWGVEITIVEITDFIIEGESLDIISLVFPEGINCQALAYSLSVVIEAEGVELEVQSVYRRRGDNVLVIQVNIPVNADKRNLERSIKKEYELAVKALNQKHYYELKAKSTEIEGYKRENFNLIKLLEARVVEVTKMMSEARNINTGGGNYYESINTNGGYYVQGDYINMSQDLTQAANQIQELFEYLHKSSVEVDVTQAQIARDMAEQAKTDLTMRGKLLNWGQSLGDATVSDVVKGIVKLAIRSAGIPLP